LTAVDAARLSDNAWQYWYQQIVEEIAKTAGAGIRHTTEYCPGAQQMQVAAKLKELGYEVEINVERRMRARSHNYMTIKW
jgi:hypothetical protein